MEKPRKNPVLTINACGMGLQSWNGHDSVDWRGVGSNRWHDLLYGSVEMSVLESGPTCVVCPFETLATSLHMDPSIQVATMDTVQDVKSPTSTDGDFGKNLQQAIFNLKVLNGDTEYDKNSKNADKCSLGSPASRSSPPLPECVVVDDESVHNSSVTKTIESSVILIDDTQTRENTKEVGEKCFNSTSVERKTESPKTTFSIDDKMRNSLRNLVSKMQENTSGLSKFLSKPKEIPENDKYIGLEDIKNSTISNSTSSGGNLFEKLGALKSTDVKDKHNDVVFSVVVVNGKTSSGCNTSIKMSEDVIDLEDSMEDSETNEQMTNSDEDKLLEDEHPKCTETEEKKECVISSNDNLKKECRVTKDEQMLEGDCVEIKDADLKINSAENMDTSEVPNKAKDGNEIIEECDVEKSKTCDDNVPDKISSVTSIENCDKSDLSVIDVSDRSEVPNVSLDSKKDTSTVDEQTNSDPEDVSQARKRRADSEDGTQSSGDLKRTRLDIVIGKLGNQIGISPDALVCDDSSESEDSRPESDSSESSKLSETPSVHEYDEDDVQSAKKKMEIAEKQLEELIRNKIVSQLKSQKDGLISQLQNKIQELQTSNESWKTQVRELQKQVLELTVLQKKNEKRKAATAALRQITTRSVGVQVAEKIKQEPVPGATTSAKVQKSQPMLIPIATPSIAPATVIMAPTTMGAMTKPITVPSLTGAATTVVTGGFRPLPSGTTQCTITAGKGNFPKVVTSAHQIAVTPVSSQVTVTPGSSPQLFTTAFLQKPMTGGIPVTTLSNATVRSLLDSTRNQPTVATLPQAKGILAQPQQQGLIVMPTTTISTTAAASGSKSLLTKSLNAPSTVMATSVSLPTQTGVKIIDLTDDDDANAARQNTARTVTVTTGLPLQQIRPGTVTTPQLIRQVGPLSTRMPQQVLIGGTVGTQILKAGQPLQGAQPHYQLLLGTNSQQIRPGSVLTVVTPSNTQNSAVRPTASHTVTAPLTTSVTNLIPVTPAPPQLRPVQSVSTITGTGSQPVILTQSPVQAVRLPPPLQSAPSKQHPVSQTSSVTVVTPTHLNVHPAPLPLQPQNTCLPGQKALPPKPSLKISRVSQGIVLSWNMTVLDSVAEITNYQLFAYQESTSPPSTMLWKKVGDVKALPLPMACTLTHFQEGNKYHFSVRAIDIHQRIGPFSDPNSIHLTKA
ncbi:hypothetical protein ScPMuIL_004096 [Solemya velum]